ncbi:MAG: GTP cyclohydrolase II RibA [Ectothiorhodospiraceae bacterium]|nr:GTP cyclohydrolase II RibA [Ectothiorhodospiraceae bacterium]MCH8505942.1 GTP cyclohydrolase II RibA [Ectothiorhodospiraceae bacterium]
MQQAERGLFDLRRGHPILLSDAAQGLLVIPVETMIDERVDELARITGTRLRLLVTAERAEALGLHSPGNVPLSVPLPSGARVRDLLAFCASPVSVINRERVQQVSRAATPLELGALALAKTGRLLPAMLGLEVSGSPDGKLGEMLADGTILNVPLEQAQQAGARPGLRLGRISEAPVPLENAPETRFILFREENGVLEHVAVLIGDRASWPDPASIRLHSACLTGDLFGSLRCDCGEQLRNGVKAIREHGGGVLLYLAQEGRGIGLANKLRAYAIQDHGVDTVDADRILGFTYDERRYEAAVAMLEQLELKRVRLFTNNPEKVSALQRGGIEVVERVPLLGSINPHNHNYLNTKATKAGHLLHDLLSKS